jgi:mono/diheme cytochrome c family protein
VGLALKSPILFTLVLLTACSESEVDKQNASGNIGRVAVNELGCGACHEIPGISWPKSKVGPPLENYGNRNLIAGVIPNTTENLAVFLQNAPRFVPEGGMPPIAMTEQQAADIASYLLSLRVEG